MNIVNFDNINEIIADISVSLNDPQFFIKVFTRVVKNNKNNETDPVLKSCMEEYDNLSRRIDRSGLQDSCSVRNVLLTRSVAYLLINDKGELALDTLPLLIKQLKSLLHSIGPERQYDTLRREHIIKVLEFLQASKEAQRFIKNMSKPVSHRYVENIIRATLQLTPKEVINDVHVRRAVISAWLCYLRQNVGSCFATAPAIVVHDEQPLQFLKDLSEIMNTGRLKRTFGGIEYVAPISKSWGAGDLKRNLMVNNAAHFDKLELWLSPGLTAAFESMELISSDQSPKHKAEQAKTLLTQVYALELEQNSVFVMSPEIILRRLLLQHLKITENDLTEYAHRPVGMLQSNLMIQPTASIGQSVKNQSCQSFHILLEAAETAFKSLADNALLKAWEFTLASFAETKANFTRWNLYSSLGLRPEDKGGIGPFMYEYLKTQLERIKIKINDLQHEYEQLYSQVKYVEARMQRASSEKEMEWLKIDYKTKVYEFQTVEDLRDQENNKGQRIANLYDQLIDAYYELFPQYFQEVYDADMHEVATGPYDDSPAGFRLLYKHGRTNTSQWTYIHDPQEFIECLCSFFNATERELINNEEFSGLERELSEITTAVVTHLRTEEFLETAFYRMAAAHQTRVIKDPLHHLDKVEKKPWAYTSGGTMGTLVSCYFGLEDKPTEVSRWVENPMELLVFFVDSIKQMPPKLNQDFVSNPDKSLLIHSPTHAFLLKPGKKMFREAWQAESFTYTWIRDNYIKRMESAVGVLLLDEPKQDYLIDLLAPKIPENFRYYFTKTFSKHFGVMSSVMWRNHLMDTMEKERGLKFQGQPVLFQEELDSFLYTHLPLIPYYQVKESLPDMLESLCRTLSLDKNLALKIWEALAESKGYSPYFTAKSLQELIKVILCLASGKTSLPVNLHKLVLEEARNHSFALQEPIIFADTNWVKDQFAFLISPGSGKLEFWRVDPLGSTGYPMSIWVQWLNGSRKDIPWGIYTRPYEYIK